MRRKVYEQLKKWKEEQNGESAVLINGARRVHNLVNVDILY